jgi:hypothetical protein
VQGEVAPEAERGQAPDPVAAPGSALAVGWAGGWALASGWVLELGWALASGWVLALEWASAMATMRFQRRSRPSCSHRRNPRRPGRWQG